MIDAEYEELNEPEGELDLADTDSLPWLESDEEDEAAGGYDMMRIAGFFTLMVALLAAVVGGVWWVSNKATQGDMVADGSVIEAPAGPIKERPTDPGGKEFAGTGNVAPVVGEGGTRPAVVASGETPPLTGPDGSLPTATKPVPIKPTAAASPAAKPSIDTVAATPAPAAAGVGVQLAAY
ncbi:MAG: SPOR domain-containing protein, partial [Erythrobacter sp.]|nr:SPOR domain-containing protein [Erythrobacter sp.]